MKMVVLALWTLETIHICLIMAWFYDISVDNFGNKDAFEDLTWTYCVGILFHGLVGTVVQWFFSWRVWKVSGRWYLAVPPAFISIFRCSLAFFIGIEFGRLGEIGFRDKYMWTFVLAQALNTVTDVWNATALVLYLRSRRSTYKSTNDMINRMMIFSLETGMVTAGLALALCVTWSAMPHNEVWNGILFVYTRMNANAVLAALNVRSAHKNHSSHVVTPSSRAGMSVTYTREVNVEMDNLPSPERSAIKSPLESGIEKDYTI
jgi:hypothetical protein